MIPTATPLPIDALLPEIVRRLEEKSSLVLEAPPGAGKTTRVPPALLDVVEGEILVAQPRRLAARMAARRIALERGVPVGGLVGYQVRFDEKVGPATRIKLVTGGVLLRRLIQDPTLEGVGAVLLDEFHERRLDGDFALGLLRRLQRGRRPDLRVVAMSATLDADPVAAYLGTTVVRSEGRPHPVTVEHLERPDDRPIEKQVVAAVRRLVQEEIDGDILVFLPGAREIRRSEEALAELASRRGLLVVPLHGDLPADAQDRAVRPGERRKVILSTNVAETSVTIEGVTAVVDSGLARVPYHSPWSGIPSLRVAPISQASAAQRAGRAGRTRPGRCLRLYTRHDHDTRPSHDPPEVLRLDLTGILLQLAAAGVTDPRTFDWLDPPPEAALAAAGELLARLGAVAGGHLTETGRAMLRLPVSPRIARAVVEAERRGAGKAAALLGAVLSERDLRARSLVGSRQAETSGPSDVLDAMDRFVEAQRARFEGHRLRAAGIDAGAARSVDRARRQLEGLVRPGRGRARDDALLCAILTGFPDRVARRRRPGGKELVLSGGGACAQADESIVLDAPLVVVVDAEERAGASSAPLARAVSRIEADWLLDLYPERLTEEREVVFDPGTRRVEVVARLSYERAVLDESRRPPSEAEADEAARVLARAALAAGIERLMDADAFSRWRNRLAFCAEVAPDAGFAPPTDEALANLVVRAARGCTSFADLERAGLLALLQASLPPDQRRLLDRLAPERVPLRGRNSGVPVHYEPGQPPWIASRLQDFHGMTETPRIGGGKVPLVVHLLAPNRRAVQVTTDLASFWENHYPKLRTQLMRRYPKHPWPP